MSDIEIFSKISYKCLPDSAPLVLFSKNPHPTPPSTTTKNNNKNKTKKEQKNKKQKQNEKKDIKK